MKPFFILLLFLSFTLVDSSGQNNFYATDSSIVTGVKIRDDGYNINSKYCQVIRCDSIIRYTPYDIDMYGFKDGRVFVSKDIQINNTIKKAFLERLVEGNVVLYYYREKNIKTYFLEKDSTLFIELPKRKMDIEDSDFKEKLLILTNDSGAKTELVNLVNYNKISLTNYISMYNSEKKVSFPFFKYGVILGYGITKLKTPSKIDDEYFNLIIQKFNFRFDGGLTFGGFIDCPIITNNITFHSAIYFIKHGYSYSEKYNNTDYDLVSNLLLLCIPAQIRYSYPSTRFKPFIELGGLYNYTIKNEFKIYESVINQDIITINTLNEFPSVSNNMFGFTSGGGLEISLNYRNSFFFEIQYNRSFGFPKFNSVSMSEIQFISGINF